MDSQKTSYNAYNNKKKFEWVASIYAFITCLSSNRNFDFINAKGYNLRKPETHGP